jgi:hypothetical protein
MMFLVNWSDVVAGWEVRGREKFRKKRHKYRGTPRGIGDAGNLRMSFAREIVVIT